MLAPLDRKLLRDLWDLRGQALAIVLVVGAGVALFVMALGVVQALDGTLKSYYATARFGDVFASLVRAPRSLERRLAEIPGVAGVQTRVAGAATLDLGGRAIQGRVVSVPESGQPKLNRLYLVRGRWPAAGSTDEILLSEPFAEARNLRPGDSLNATIHGHRRQLKIVGLALSPEFIYTLAPGQLMPDAGSYGVLWMPRPAAAAAFDMEGAFNDLVLRLSRGARSEAVIARADDLLASYGGTGAYTRRDQTSHAFIRNEIDGLIASAKVTPPLFLAVGAFLLHLVVGRMIDRERAQIGLLKAFGYTDAAVGWHYTKFVLLLTLLGIAVGIAVGGWFGRGLAELYTAYFHFPHLRYTLTPRLLVLAGGVTVAAALLGTIASVRRAAKLPPAVAMRPPEPPHFRRGLADRLGISQVVDPATRMILRNLGRRPMRAGLTALGIATAVGLLVSSLFMGPAVEVLIRSETTLAQRQDMTVTLTDVTGPAAVTELAGLPGVLAAEPFRSVPAKLGFDGAARRIGVEGLRRDGRLRRVLTVDHNVVAPPEVGIALSEKLAELLGVGRGERVTLAVLEGRRPVRRVPVTDVVRQYAGLAAYMDLNALNALMGEGDNVSGVHLRVDGARIDAVSDALLNRPRVAGVTRHAELLSGLRQTLDRNLMLMVSFFIGFAVTMAVGVVYNSARIALAERSRELASLRVLGFTRGEVSYILLGELGLLTALALPLGCALGYGASALMVWAYDTELFRMPLVVPASTYAWSVLTVTVATVAAGWLVRRRIDRLDLIAVLKTRE